MCDVDEERLRALQALAERLGFPLSNPALLDQALTHASAVGETERVSGDYEALEFLGDAALGLAVAHYLYHNVPDRTPGEYSRMRAGVVNRRCLARVARRLDIAPLVRLGRGEELSGGRNRRALLADCLEAIIGALYQDAGWPATQEFVERVFEAELDETVSAEPVWDYKSRLQHHCQAERLALPEFRVIRSEGPDHRKEFEVACYLRQEPVGLGVGHTKKEAEQNAAREALAHEGLAVGR
jgi:ribonuclease-3